MASCGSSTTEGASDVSPFHLFSLCLLHVPFSVVLFCCVACFFLFGLVCVLFCFACAAGIFLTIVADVSR